MRIISVCSILAGFISAVIGLVSRIRGVPIFGIAPHSYAVVTIIFLLFAVAINTLPEDL